MVEAQEVGHGVVRVRRHGDFRVAVAIEVRDARRGDSRPRPPTPLILPDQPTAGADTEDLPVVELAVGDDGFIHIPDPNIAPCVTDQDGIFAAGVATGPMDIVDSIVTAGAAAAEAAAYLEVHGELLPLMQNSLEPVSRVAEIDRSLSYA